MIKTNYVYMAAIVNILITDTIIKMYNRPIATFSFTSFICMDTFNKQEVL